MSTTSGPAAVQTKDVIILAMRVEEDAKYLLMTLERVQKYDHHRGVSDHNDRHYAIDGIIDALKHKVIV